MAKNNIREGVTVKFTDGEEREVYPVTLRNLRKLTKIVEKFDLDKDEVDDDMIDLMIEAAAIVLSQTDKELADDAEALEDLLDIKTFNTILAVGMGTDPNA